MNELTKAKGRILGKIEMYIGDIEFAEEKELTEDEKTIFKSVKDIINEELTEATLDPTLPRFIIHEDDRIEQIKTSDTAKWVVAGIGIDCTGNRFEEYKCSKCGNIDLSHRKNKFCPNCGCRMKG